MTKKDWAKLLKTYRTPEEAARETLEGVADHLDTPCQGNRTRTEYRRNRYSGVGPVEVPAVCDRGSRGCNLVHNDHQALNFTRMGLERAVELMEK